VALFGELKLHKIYTRSVGERMPPEVDDCIDRYGVHYIWVKS
jgi:hypothetical protein